jgi:hypothetical protein
MKVPTCDCLPLNGCAGEMRPCQKVYINRSWDDDGTPTYGKYLQLHFCPQCGKPYKESEE